MELIQMIPKYWYWKLWNVILNTHAKTSSIDTNDSLISFDSHAVWIWFCWNELNRMFQTVFETPCFMYILHEMQKSGFIFPLTVTQYALHVHSQINVCTTKAQDVKTTCHRTYKEITWSPNDCIRPWWTPLLQRN